jgi:membrane protein implicated in regulation of membrane protease activity
MTLSLIYTAELWIALGLLLLVIEIFDGSMALFLPSGVGALANAGVLYLQTHGQWVDYLLITRWHEVLLSFAILSGIAVVIIRLFFKPRQTSKADINDY